MILFMSDPHMDLARVFERIVAFGQFSGYKINIAKSEALPSRSSISGINSLGEKLHVKIANSHITYLGIKIVRFPDTLYSLGQDV